MPARDLVINEPTKAVLGALVAHPTRDHHPAAIHAETGLSSGRVYPVLARLEALQWVDSGWAEPTSREQGWPRRRYYRLSERGLAMARGALASARSSSAVNLNLNRPRMAGESS